MHVAINALFLEPPMGGLETYVHELCSGLLALTDAPSLTVFAGPRGYESIVSADWSDEAEVVNCPRLGKHGLRAFSELALVGAAADRRKVDVIHSVAMTGPLFSRAARVVTIPDTIWITHPEATFTHRLWRAVVPLVARRSARVLAISHAAGRELEDNLGVPSDRLDVIPLGFGSSDRLEPLHAQALRERLGLPAGPIVLNVGQKKPHRNIERLVQALALVRQDVPDAQLVLPGPPAQDEDARSLDAVISQAGLGEAVHLPGFVSAEELEGLYAAASAFVLPSLIEGFGLPVLEAMARGVPVACSAESAPAEVAGDAALLFDPTSVEAIAAATTRLLVDPVTADRLKAAGPPRAAQFTWQACAEQTLESYTRAIQATG